MTDPLGLIHQIVEAEPFILNDAVVERVLNLLIEAVAESGRAGVVVKVPGLGIFDATDADGRLMFRFYAEDYL